jgi:hypothetical protein
MDVIKGQLNDVGELLHRRIAHKDQMSTTQFASILARFISELPSILVHSRDRVLCCVSSSLVQVL